MKKNLVTEKKGFRRYVKFVVGSLATAVLISVGVPDVNAGAELNSGSLESLVATHEQSEINLDELNNFFTDELLRFVDENKLNVELEDIQLEFKEDPSQSELNQQELKEAVELELENIKEGLLATENSLEENLVTTRLKHHGGTSYTASVWSGVPAVGWGYIQQDFVATVSNNRISNTRFTSNSFQVGVVSGSWTPIRSWFELSNNNTHLDIRMRGTLTYGIPNTILSGTITATFLQTTRGSGNRLVLR